MREWPSDGRTEVIITNGDFFRLEEAEYLNDTLIEFGLKYHWFDLDDEAAAPAGKKLKREDIHIFNSFFYKKLSVRNKPGYKEANPNGLSWPAYETVKKWTNKVNIFAKKMLIVPINENLHWYLAIILNPGAVLRKTLAAAGSSEAVEGGDDSTEAQKEAVLSQQLEEEKKQEEIDQAKELAKRSTNQDDEQDPLDVISSRERPMDVDADSDVEELPDRKSDDEDIGKRLGARSATRATNAGKQPVKIAEPIPLAPPSEWPPAEEGKSTRRGPINPPAPKPPKTPFSPDEPVIMTFDSLSATHATVGKILNKWLVYEALDKAQDETSLGETDWDQHFPAAYKAVRVPGQDNFADCGVYVLHYAIQLMRDDGELRQYVFDQAAVKTNQDKEKNKEKWNAMDMAIHREAWKSVIDSLPLGKGKGGSKKDESKPEGSKDITQSGAAEGQSTANATSAQDSASVEKKAEFVDRASGSEPVQSVPHQRMDTVDSRGPSPRSPSPSRSSPLKRSITISPVAAEDGPVNKRRKIIEERVAVQDMCQDSQAGSSPRVDASLLDHDEPMEHQDAPMVPSQSRSASPVQGSAILAVESPEAVEIRHGSHNAMMSLANELSEVKMTEAPFVSSGSVDTASHAPTPPPMSPVATAMEISNVYNRITEATRKETARDRLRRDHDAEPARLPVQPRMTSKASAKASRVHTEEFPQQPEYLDIEQGLRSMFKDTMFKPFRVALDEEKDSVIGKLKLHHNLTSPSAPSQGAQSTRATADGGMDTLDETSTNGIAGGGCEVVHVYSDDDEDVKME
jgi:Ulp1 family protease